MPVTKIHTNDDFAHLTSKGLAIADFGAVSWCGPCRFIKPKFIDLSNDAKYKSVQFLDIDVDENPAISQKFVTSGIPLFVAFNNGQVVGTVTGANEAKIKELVDKLVSSITATTSVPKDDAATVGVPDDDSGLGVPVEDEHDYEVEE
jgi:thioredoxin 1